MKSRYGAWDWDTTESIPAVVPLVDGYAIDRNVAESTPCPECGGRCEYDSIHEGDSYRAFAVCVDCGNRHEF